MTHTLQSCDKEWKKRGQKCGREYKWALVLVMWRGYMFLSTQKFEEEKLGKVERKVEPEKQWQLQVGVCLGTVGRSSAPFRFYDIDRHDHDYDHDEDNADHRDHDENGDDHDVRRSSAGGRCSSCPN